MMPRMPLSLLALVLILCGGAEVAFAETLEAGPVEVPASHEAPGEVEDADAEEDGVPEFQAVVGAGVMSIVGPDEVQGISMDRAVHSPPPER